MSIFQHPKVFSKIIFSWTAFVICIICILLILNKAFSFYVKNETVVEKLNQNKEKAAKLEKEIAENRDKLNFLSSERGKEEYFRNTYPVASADEKVIFVYNATESPVEIISTSTNVWTEMKNKFLFFIDNYTNL